MIDNIHSVANWSGEMHTAPRGIIAQWFTAIVFETRIILRTEVLQSL